MYADSQKLASESGREGENRLMFCASILYGFNFSLFPWWFVLSTLLKHKSSLKTSKCYDVSCCMHHPLKSMSDCRGFGHFWLNSVNSNEKGNFFFFFFLQIISDVRSARSKGPTPLYDLWKSTLSRWMNWSELEMSKSSVFPIVKGCGSW